MSFEILKSYISEDIIKCLKKKNIGNINKGVERRKKNLIFLVDLVYEEFEVEFKRLEEFKCDVFYNGKSHIYEGSNEEEVLIPLMKNFQIERKKKY